MGSPKPASATGNLPEVQVAVLGQTTAADVKAKAK